MEANFLFRTDESILALTRWADGITDEFISLQRRVRELERNGSEHSVRGTASGQRARRGRRPSPMVRTLRPILMGEGSEDVPYTLVEIDGPVAGPLREPLRQVEVEEVVETQAEVVANTDPVPPYEE